MKNQLIEKLKSIPHIQITENASIKQFNAYHIDTHVSILITPQSITSLKQVCKILNTYEKKYIVIGLGKKILFLKKNSSIIVILINENINNIYHFNDEVYVSSGCTLNNLIIYCKTNNLCGIEKLYGIPATIGGAITNNVGAFNVSISDKLCKVDIIDENNDFKTMDLEECIFSYRNSIFKNNKKKVIVGALFKFDKQDSQIIDNTIKSINEYRRNKHPKTINCGSIFKNKINLKAYEYIIKNRLNSYSINETQVNTLHANFIDNNSESSLDLILLIFFIQNIVLQNDKILLETELEIIKD